MNMQIVFRSIAAASVAAFALAACGGGGSGSAAAPNPPTNGGASGPSTALGNGPFLQLDRLNRPAVSELFATFAQHQKNNTDTPDDDVAILKPEIISFTENVAGRSSAIATVLGTVLTPDVQIVDMNGTSSSCIGTAPGTCNNYLGIETGGATQTPSALKPFGGRALTDDIVGISLGVIFGNTIPALGLAPDDNAEQDGRADAAFPSGHRPNLTNDNVTWQTAPKHFTTTFPYLGTPQ